MSRQYTTIENQTIYDICVQKFGGLDDIDEVMRVTPDLNGSLPTNTTMTLSDSTDELANRFDVNAAYFATGPAEAEEIEGGYEYEYEFGFEG